MKTINLQIWVDATNEERRKFIEEKVVFDDVSGIAHGLRVFLNKRGHDVTEEQITKAWQPISSSVRSKDEIVFALVESLRAQAHIIDDGIVKKFA